MSKKEHLLIQALRGEEVARPPVWMMRQAGRYMPEYLKLRDKYDFWTRVQTPELACEITLQPIQVVKPDAAILFSDILNVPQAMGMEVQLVPGKGPWLPKPIKSRKDVLALQDQDAADRMAYVYDAIKLTKQELNGQVPLIGFAGAPFTLLCYMIEGEGSKTFSKAKSFCFTEPQAAHRLLEMLTRVTIEYLERQVAAGAEVVQVFDSWAGLLSPADFREFAQPYLVRIAAALEPKVPVILFPKGCWFALSSLAESVNAAFGIDWTLSPTEARWFCGDEVTLQGNFDPSWLLLPIPKIQQKVHEMIRAFGPQHYIANLGHGIMPNTPVDHAKAFVEAVKNYPAS